MQPRHDQITKPKQFMRQYNSHNLTKCEIQSLLDPDFFQASQNKNISFDRHAPYSRNHDFLLKQFRNDQAHHSDSNSPAT